jgi:hypothetical protein
MGRSKKSSKIYDFLSVFDIISEKVELTFENSKKYTSIMSILLSFIIIVFSFFTLIEGLNGLFNRTKYFIATKKAYISEGDINTEFLMKNLPIGFMFSQNGKPQNLIDISSIISISAFSNQRDPNSNQIQLRNIIGYKTCSEVLQDTHNISTMQQQMASSLPGNQVNYFCLDPKSRNFLNVSLSENNFVEIMVSLSNCLIPSQQNLPCNFKENQTITIFFGDTSINDYNFTNPLEYYFRTKTYDLDPRVKKTLRFNYGPVSLESHNGYVFTETKTSDGLRLATWDSDFTPISQPTNGRPIFKISIYGANTQQFYYRYYKVLPALLAETGGLINSFVILGILVNYLYDTNYRYLRLASNYYHELKTIDPKRMFISDLNNKSNNRNDIILLNNNINNDGRGRNLKNLGGAENLTIKPANDRSMMQSQAHCDNIPAGLPHLNTIRSNISQLPQNPQMTEKIFDYIKWTDILFYQCRPNNNKKKKFMDDLISRMMNRLSLEYLFKKYQEMDMMKCVLFKGDEIRLLNSLPSPYFFKEFPFEDNKFPYSFPTFDNYLLLSNDYIVQDMAPDESKINNFNILASKIKKPAENPFNSVSLNYKD